MTLYKNKYRIESIRLKNWDYSSNGFYYITICVNNRECVFGNIDDGQLILSDLGRIAEQCWREIPNHFPFVRLDEFVIMPNHVHGIIIIDKSENGIVETQNLASPPRGMSVSVETQNLASLQSKNFASPQKNPASPSRGMSVSVETQNLASLQSKNPASPQLPSKYGPQSKNVGSIIRGFKIGVTKFATRNNIPFKWQSRFYDHIIRSEEDLARIQKYIYNNPKNWHQDDYFKK